MTIPKKTAIQFSSFPLKSMKNPMSSLQKQWDPHYVYIYIIHLSYIYNYIYIIIHIIYTYIYMYIMNISLSTWISGPIAPKGWKSLAKRDTPALSLAAMAASKCLRHHGSTMTKPTGFMVIFIGETHYGHWNRKYPLVNIQKAMESGHF